MSESEILPRYTREVPPGDMGMDCVQDPFITVCSISKAVHKKELSLYG